MRSCTCGGREFHCEQTYYVEIVVNPFGEFVRNRNGAMEKSLSGAEKPSAPFTCVKCGKTHNSLDNLQDTES